MGGGGAVNATPRPLYPQNRHPISILREAGLAQESAQTGTDNLVPTGIRSQDRPVRSKSLYWLSYPGPHKHELKTKKINTQRKYASEQKEKGKKGEE